MREDNSAESSFIHYSPSNSTPRTDGLCALNTPQSCRRPLRLLAEHSPSSRRDTSTGPEARPHDLGDAGASPCAIAGPNEPGHCVGAAVLGTA